LTASIDYGIQASYNFKSLMINVRGRDREEFANNLDAVRELALQIDEVGEALAANANKPLTEDQRAETERLLTSELGAQTISRTCQHGDMKLKEGATWKAWMCPARQGDPSQCQPIDFKTGRPWPKK
jgi:hypothetical protein